MKDEADSSPPRSLYFCMTSCRDSDSAASLLATNFVLKSENVQDISMRFKEGPLVR